LFFLFLLLCGAETARKLCVDERERERESESESESESERERERERSFIDNHKVT